MQYSIWVIPPEPVYTQIKSIVDKLAKIYSGPLFEPHMTLLGNIDGDLSDIEKKVTNLAKNADTLELSLGPVSFSTTYFQSVFVRVNSTAQLLQLNLEAKKMFGLENSVFMPHISLLYGDHTMTTREETALKIQLPQASFVIKELVVIPATSDLSGWKHIAGFSLG